MNRQRYASITSHLLVRKGEAKPWQVPGTEQHEFAHVPENIVPVKAEHHFTEEEKNSAAEYENWKRAREAEAAAPDLRTAHLNGHTNGNSSGGHASSHARREHHLETDEHSKRLTLRLTPSEYERLGIIGVKRDMTRQQLLRHAIDSYLAAAKTEYQSACGCLAGEGCKGEC